MNNNKIISTEDSAMLTMLADALSEKADDCKDAPVRWKTRFASLFSSISKVVSRFFVSQVKSNEIVKLQSNIRQFFRRTDMIETIKNDSGLQNAFFMGYCHAVDGMIANYEEAFSFNQNDSLKAAITSYEYLKPILLILGENFEMGHEELAEQARMSESSLSNFMNKVQSYHLFHSTHVGEKRYYSLAHPNGEKALRIVKEDSRPSLDSYTDFMLLLLDSLHEVSRKNMLDENYVMRRCGKLLASYTTKPEVCEKRISDLARILNAERFHINMLMAYESQEVENNVTIITKDIQSERFFSKTIINNLKKKIEYKYFFVVPNIQEEKERARELLYDQFHMIYNCEYEDDVKRIKYCFIPPEEAEDILKDKTDIVIYDSVKAYGSIDQEISGDTIYEEITKERKNICVSYTENKAMEIVSPAI